MSTDAERGMMKLELNARYAGGEQYRGGVYPALQPGDVIDVNSLYPAALRDDAPSSPVCPLHGEGCEAWA
jgi:hypothetical protein